jgi:lipocalin-like protein
MRKGRIVGILGLLCLAASSALPRTSAPALVGTWRLVSNEQHGPDGTVTEIWGSHPRGRLMYDAGGRMSVQLMNPARKNFASEDRLAGTPEEVRQAFEGYLAYFGSYTLNAKEGMVIHHVEGSSFPNLIATAQRRLFTLSGNRLTLRTPPMLRGGRTSTYVLVWEREDQ